MHESAYRNKIHIFSTVLSILVIWVHSVNTELFFKSEYPTYIDFIETKIIAVGQIAVPGFFILSAYLFFRNLNESNFMQKIRRRITSLVLPFFIWNAIYYLAYMSASRVPYLSTIIGKGIIAFDRTDLLEAILFYKYNFVFWFVFQLILLIVLTPVLHFILKSRKISVFFLFLLLVYLCFHVKILLLNADALFYFVLGAFCSRFLCAETEREFQPPRLLLGLVLAVSAYTLNRLYLKHGYPVLAVICRSFGVVSLWLCLYVPKTMALPSFFRNSFFVYAIHFLIARLINKFFAHVYPNHDKLAIGLFLLMPFLILLLSDRIVVFLKTHAVQVHRILSGNR